MPAALGLDEAADGAPSGGASSEDGSGAALDERISESGRRFELAAQEADGRLEALTQFSETARAAMGTASSHLPAPAPHPLTLGLTLALTLGLTQVRGAMDTASARRDEAQKALEVLAVEQRRASEQLKLTVGQALGAMEQMQSQWDAAVASNAAELRELQSDAADTAKTQADELARLRGARAELDRQTAALEALSDERRSLAASQDKLRKRYALLRQRRQAKLGGKGNRAIDMPLDLEEVAEASGAVAEKAAVALLRFFGNKDDDGDDGSKALPAAKS